MVLVNMQSVNNFYVVGGSGFVGTRLCKRLSKAASNLRFLAKTKRGLSKQNSY